MSTWHSISRMCAAAILVIGAGLGWSQDYPQRPLRIITTNPGGSSDIVARLVAAGLTRQLGQQVVVDNRPTPFPGLIASKAPSDGYTLLVGNSSLWILPLLREVAYDTVRDFSTIAIIGSVPNILVVHPSVPATSVKDIIALTKAKPGALNYASGPSGGGSHLGMELFKYMTGVNIVRVAYKGGGAAVIGLVGGEVQMTFDDPLTVMPNVKIGKLRALAVTSPKTYPFYPDLPTVAASVPGYESETFVGAFVPIKTSATIIKRLNQEIVRLVNEPDTKERFANLGMQVVGSSPEAFASALKTDIATLGKLIKDLGIKAD